MPATRRSRRVAGLSPATITPPAPAPAPAPQPSVQKSHGFRRTAARAGNTPRRVLGTRKRPIDDLPETCESVAKRQRPSSTEAPPNDSFIRADTPDAQLRRELVSATASRGEDKAAPTPPSQGNPPGILSPPAILISPVVLPVVLPVVTPVVPLPAHSPIKQRLYNFFAPFISLLKPADDTPKDQTNLLQVFEAIASWKAKNQGKPLPNVSQIQDFLDNHGSSASPQPQVIPTAGTKHAIASTTTITEPNFSSTFRAPSPNNPADWSSDESDDEEMSAPRDYEQAKKILGQQSTSFKASTTSFSNTFRAPSPNNPDDWSSDSDSDLTDEEPVTASRQLSTNTQDENDVDEELLNTPCPKNVAKRYTRSRSSSINSTTQAQSIFDRGAHTTTTNTTLFAATGATPGQVKDKDKEQTPESVSPHITYLQRTPAPRKAEKKGGPRSDMSRSIIHANFLNYIEGKDINIKIPINQQIVDDFNRRAVYTGNEGEKEDGLEMMIAEVAMQDAWDKELEEFKGFPSKAMPDAENMDIDELMDDSGDGDEDMEKDEFDFDLGRLRNHPFKSLVDMIPDDEFMDLY